jgi:hypothetical protein
VVLAVLVTLGLRAQPAAAPTIASQPTAQVAGTPTSPPATAAPTSAPTAVPASAATLPRAVVAYHDYRDAGTATALEAGRAYTPVGRAGMAWLLLDVGAPRPVWVRAADAGLTVDPALPDHTPRPTAAPAPVSVPPAAPPVAQPEAEAAPTAAPLPTPAPYTLGEEIHNELPRTTDTPLEEEDVEPESYGKAIATPEPHGKVSAP